MSNFILNLIIFATVFSIVLPIIIWTRKRPQELLPELITSKISRVATSSATIRERRRGNDTRKNRTLKSRVFSNISSAEQEFLKKVKRLTVKAGMREYDAVEKFLRMKMIAMVVLFLGAYLVIEPYCPAWNIPMVIQVFISLVFGIMAGHWCTDLQLAMLAQEREKEIDRGVPDLIDLFIICVEAGLSLNKCIKRIAEELRSSNRTLRDELAYTSIELEMMPNYKVVFRNLEDRVESQAINVVSRTISQSIEHGASLSVSLKNIAIEARRKRMLLAEAKAAKIPTLMILPMVFFTLPCLFIVMLGPVILDAIRNIG
ncbi:MAG: type II secretion system F family protein [Holosporaceae bacterium]|jgi:tight adherence protein C|nr:type II secretion system F family protein [Holosporaceae bacterium]